MWIEEALARNERERDGRWTEALAVGSENFVIDARRELGMRGIYRSVEPDKGAHVLRDAAQDSAYNTSFRL